MESSKDMVLNRAATGRFRRAAPERPAGRDPSREACVIGEALNGFVERLGPAPIAGGTVGEVLPRVLPPSLRKRCRVASVSDGCVRLVADGSSYVYELQLCKAGLLEELQRLCPAARLRRIEVTMAR